MSSSTSINLNNFQILGPALNIAASGSQIVDLDMDSLKGLIVAVQITTSGSPNVTATLFDGFGGGDSTSVLNYGIPLVVGGSSVPLFTSSGTSYNLTAAVSDILVLVDQLPRWLRIQLKNNDAQKCTVQLYGCI